MLTDDWQGCYSGGWNGVIVPEAFSHPAKVSFALAERIYQHVLGEGWLAPGSTVLDPFGGIGGFAFHAMLNGINFVGVELEPKFVSLGNQNIEKWNREYAGKLPRWGRAVLLQGDSRNLANVIGGADGLVSSPPYAESMERPGGIDPAKSTHVGGPHSQMNNSDTRYGSTPGQLGSMKAGGFDAALTPGNLGTMDASVSSPPFESSDMRKGGSDILYQQAVRRGRDPNKPGTVMHLTTEPYGTSPGNVGNQSGDDFWTAARLIVDQVYGLLKPGGVSVWVCKRFVKDKKIVEFSQQWAMMCEAAGFKVMHWHKAWLVEDKGTQYDLFGNGHKKEIARKSFFRRLAEKRGSPAIDWEDVICMVK